MPESSLTSRCNPCSSILLLCVCVCVMTAFNSRSFPEILNWIKTPVKVSRRSLCELVQNAAVNEVVFSLVYNFVGFLFWFGLCFFHTNLNEFLCCFLWIGHLIKFYCFGVFFLFLWLLGLLLLVKRNKHLYLASMILNTVLHKKWFKTS